MANATWQADAQRNTEHLDRSISDLKDELDRSNYRDFWQKVKDVQALFKELKPTRREEREQLWSKFGSLCSQAKEQQEREREKRSNTSRMKRELVDSKLNEAYYQAKGARSGSDLKVADELLELAKEWMKDGYGAFNIPTQLLTFNDGVMTKADADACWTKFKEVKEIIKWRRKEFSDFNYNEFKRDAGEARALAESDPKEAKEKVKQVQQAMKGRTMEAWQFDDIRRILDDTYRIANSVLKRRHEEWERKNEEWRSRMLSAKSRKFELREKNRSLIRSLEDQIDRCRDMLSEARSSEHEERVQGWIDEKLEKIRDIERFDDELDDQIRDIDSKLSQ